MGVARKNLETTDRHGEIWSSINSHRSNRSNSELYDKLHTISTKLVSLIRYFRLSFFINNRGWSLASELRWNINKNELLTRFKVNENRNIFLISHICINFTHKIEPRPVKDDKLHQRSGYDFYFLNHRKGFYWFLQIVREEKCMLDNFSKEELARLSFELNPTITCFIQARCIFNYLIKYEDNR